VISGDPEIDPAARRVTGAALRTSACRRSAPLAFFPNGENRTGNGPRATREWKGKRMTKHRSKREREPAPAPPSDADLKRVTNNYVGYWTVCGASACKRQRGCAGDAEACFERFWRWTPESIKIRFRASIKALNEGVTSVAELTRITDAEVERAAEHIARVDAETARAWEAAQRAPQKPQQTPHPAAFGDDPLPQGEREEERRGPRVRAL